MLVVVCGLPGTGKTTVASVISERVEGALVRSDVVRKALVSEPTYRTEETARVYDRLLERGRAEVSAERTAVLDATFRQREHRRRARSIAADVGVPFRLVQVTCDPATVRERLERREDDESDADVAVYESFRGSFDAIGIPHTRIDNSGPLESTRERVRAEFSDGVDGAQLD